MKQRNISRNHEKTKRNRFHLQLKCTRQDFVSNICVNGSISFLYPIIHVIVAPITNKWCGSYAEEISSIDKLCNLNSILRNASDAYRSLNRTGSVLGIQRIRSYFVLSSTELTNRWFCRIRSIERTVHHTQSTQSFMRLTVQCGSNSTLLSTSSRYTGTETSENYD